MDILVVFTRGRQLHNEESDGVQLVPPAPPSSSLPSCLFCCFSHLASRVLTGRCLTLQSQTSAQLQLEDLAPLYLLDSSEL